MVSLKLKKDARPVQQGWTRIPVHLRPAVDCIIDDLLRKQRIEKVEGPSEWQSAVVTAKKGDGALRMCTDMRMLNKAIERERFELPTLEDLQVELEGSKHFSVFDFKDAFHHILLDEESRALTTFVTHRGLFRYRVLNFGLASASEIFQRTMQNHVLRGLPGVFNYIDDVMVYGKSQSEHDTNASQFLQRVEEMQVELNMAKSQISQSCVKFMGHSITRDGISPAPGKIDAVVRFATPKNKDELKSFLGLVGYVTNRFRHDLAELTNELRAILNSKGPFCWNEEAEEAFKKLKDVVQNTIKLSFYVKKDRTLLYADASPTAIGAVLVQIDSNGNARVVSCASKSLTEVERRYAQTEREALALV